MSDTVTAGGHRPIDDYEGEATALESRADIASLEGLHAERRQILPEYAALRALHGPANHWDKRRKAMLSAISVRIRMSTPPNGKWTESAVDDAAHADPQYIRFVDEGIDAATRYFLLDNQMQELNERIDDRRNAMFAYAAEARLAQ